MDLINILLCTFIGPYANRTYKFVKSSNNVYIMLNRHAYV